MTVTYTPDMAREAVFALVDGETFAGRIAHAFYELPMDYTEVGDDHASVLLYATGGTVGYIDRVDRLTMKVFAPGQDAVRVAEAIRDTIVPGPHDLGGTMYLDEILSEVAPYDSVYPSTVNQAYASYLVRYRPQESWPVSSDGVR